MATATQSAHSKELDPQKQSSTSRHFEEELRQRVVGQNEVVQASSTFIRYDPEALAAYPQGDVTVERIGDLLSYELSNLRAV